jgi:hypothetical protein
MSKKSIPVVTVHARVKSKCAAFTVKVDARMNVEALKVHAWSSYQAYVRDSGEVLDALSYRPEHYDLSPCLTDGERPPNADGRSLEGKRNVRELMEGLLMEGLQPHVRFEIGHSWLQRDALGMAEARSRQRVLDAWSAWRSSVEDANVVAMARARALTERRLAASSELKGFEAAMLAVLQAKQLRDEAQSRARVVLQRQQTAWQGFVEELEERVMGTEREKRMYLDSLAIQSKLDRSVGLRAPLFYNDFRDAALPSTGTNRSL